MKKRLFSVLITCLVSFVSSEYSCLYAADSSQLCSCSSDSSSNKVIITKEFKDKNFSLKKKIYKSVKKMPSYPGGEAKMKEYLKGNMIYPVKSQKNGVMGRVFIQFVVSDKGKIYHTTVVRGVSPELDAESIRLVESMPDWLPGEENGKRVDVEYVIPIDFVIIQ